MKNTMQTLKAIINNDTVITIGDTVITKDGRKETITNLSSSSIEVFETKANEGGIICKKWFFLDDFVDEFMMNGKIRNK